MVPNHAKHHIWTSGHYMKVLQTFSLGWLCTTAISREATTILNFSRETSNRHFSKNTNIPEKHPFMAAIYHNNLTWHIQFLFRSCSMGLKGYKVHFKHPLYTLVVYWKSRRNWCKLMRNPFMIYALLIVLVKV